MFADRDKHYPSRSGQTNLATAVTNITKPLTKINFGPGITSSIEFAAVVSVWIWLQFGHQLKNAAHNEEERGESEWTPNRGLRSTYIRKPLSPVSRQENLYS